MNHLIYLKITSTLIRLRGIMLSTSPILKRTVGLTILQLLGAGKIMQISMGEVELQGESNLIMDRVQVVSSKTNDSYNIYKVIF